MSWENILLDDCTGTKNLVPHIDKLFAQQRSTWNTFRQGEAALTTIRTKRLINHDAEIIVQANPSRTRSTHAVIDAATISQRPCFLCPENIPHEERGLAFEDLVVLPNPYPILARHCTVPIRKHQPQRLVGRIASMLQLSRTLGPNMLTFYNGPLCGASAPDHFHLQASTASGIPLLAEIDRDGTKKKSFLHQSFGRTALVHFGTDPSTVEAFLERTVEKLTKDDTAEEPMLNLLIWFRDKHYVCIIFPRVVHRPACYFCKEPEQIGVSPATLEMAGLLVVSNEEHFDRLTAEAAHSIYKEVSLSTEQLEAFAEIL